LGKRIRDFLQDEAMEGYEKTLQRYMKPELLIIDDMGMKQLPKRLREHLFEIVNRRYERKPDPDDQQSTH
jgi:DNA replication protein DnaC